MPDGYVGSMRTLGTEADNALDDLRRAEAQKEKDKEPDGEKERKQKICEDAVKRFRLVETAEAEQRRRELDDLQFDRALPEDQWPEGIRKLRSGSIGPDGFQTSERPCLVINKLDQPVQQVINEARNAKLGIVIKPKSDGANQEGATIRQGLIRAIEQDSRAHIARLWALDRAVKCGRGCYRITKKYANDGDFDLDLVVERILNQSSVYLDPFAKEPDWSDGEWALITTDMPLDEYKRRYPDSELGSVSADELSAVGDRVPGWIGASDIDGNRSIRVAEYFYAEHEERTRVFVPGMGKAWLDELPDNVPLPPGTKQRVVDVRTIKWCVINATEVLEEEEWEGRYIPIIPVLGKEYSVNGDRCFKGVISNSKDAQRSYNYMRSAQVEAVGLAPKAPWIMAEGQDEGYQSMWDQSNTRNYTRLYYKPLDFNNKLLPPPQRNVAEPAIQAITMAVNAADSDIKATTGRFDPSLGRARADQSGKAINLLKESGESTTSNYLENLTSVSMHHEAKILLDLMPYVYDRPGRIIRILGEEDQDDKSVMINQPFIQGPNGQPQPAAPPMPSMQPPGMMPPGPPGMGMPPGMPPPGMPPQGMMPPPMMQPGQPGSQMMPPGMPPANPMMQAAKRVAPKMYDLRKGTYGVEITVGRSFATQREENAEMLRAIIESAPGLTPMLADLMVEQLDTPIAKRAAQRLRKLNPQLQEGDEEQQVPPAIQAQMEQFKEQNQMLTEALQAANEELKMNRYKVDVEAATKKEEIAARLQIAQIQAGTQVATTTTKVKSQEEIALLETSAESEKLDKELEHDAEWHQRDQYHEDRLDMRERVSSMGRESAARTHEKNMKVGDALTARMSQHADQQHQRATDDANRQHELVNKGLDHRQERRTKEDDYHRQVASEGRQHGFEASRARTEEQSKERDREHKTGMNRDNNVAKVAQARAKPKPKPNGTATP